MSQKFDEESIKKVIALGILGILIFLSFLIIKPIIYSIILGMILAYLFGPINKLLNKKVKNRNISAFIVCFVFFLFLILFVWLFGYYVIEQSTSIISSLPEMVENFDLKATLQNILPSFFASDKFTQEISNSLNEYLKTYARDFAESIKDFFIKIIVDLPNMALQFAIIIFVFYFVLRDGSGLKEYLKSLSPFSKDINKKLFEYTEGITSSVLYGQVAIGIVQGTIVGLSFIFFGVPNPFFWSIVALIVSIIPVIGPVLIWIPMSLYQLSNGEIFGGLGIAFFGIIASTIDNFLRPMIVSRKTRINTSIILIGMIGGFLMMGVIGLIVGPLILAYLLIILEIYRKNEGPAIFVEENS